MFNLVQRRRLFYIFSLAIIGVGFIAMLISLIRTGSPFQIGVDFQSGTRFEIEFLEDVTENEIRSVFQAEEINNPSITAIQGEAVNTWQIRSEFVTPEKANSLIAALAESVGAINQETVQVQSVSPSIGSEVTRSAVIAVGVASLIILIYIMLTFRQLENSFRYGVCAVVAMIHDILVVMGFMAITGMIFGWEVDSLFLTAMLTVAGFSLQDTIVMFDRIRENTNRRPGEDFETIVNRSILETIHRSLTTQLCAMFVMVAILLFGGASIKHFIAVLFVGLLSGTYSSIFNAVPLLVSWEKWAESRG